MPLLSSLICTACGTQYPTQNSEEQRTCRICLDPRQYVPPSGQHFTTLSDLRSKDYQNLFEPFPEDERFISITTKPQVAIGQRAILLKTPYGNILWDCIAFLDDKTIAHIQALGGLAGIVISHPHYFTTHLMWAEAFNCPVYISAKDKEWLNLGNNQYQRLICDGDEVEFEIKIDGHPSGVKIYRPGGHFEGSLVALYERRLLIADTLVITPSGRGDYRDDGKAVLEGTRRPKDRTPPATNMWSFVFMYSIPNMMPLNPDVILQMWSVLKKADFMATHGAFVGLDIEDQNVKQRVLQSMQHQVRYMGYTDHQLLEES